MLTLGCGADDYTAIVEGNSSRVFEVNTGDSVGEIAFQMVDLLSLKHNASLFPNFVCSTGQFHLQVH